MEQDAHDVTTVQGLSALLATGHDVDTCKALAVIAKQPVVLNNVQVFQALRQAIWNTRKAAETDYKKAEILVALVRSAGLIQTDKMTPEFNPFEVFEDVIKHTDPTVRKEGVETLIKLLRSCARQYTDLNFSKFYDVKTEIIIVLESVISRDKSQDVRIQAAYAYALLPRTSPNKCGDFLRRTLDEEKNDFVKRAIQRALDTEPVVLNLRPVEIRPNKKDA